MRGKERVVFFKKFMIHFSDSQLELKKFLVTNHLPQSCQYRAATDS